MLSAVIEPGWSRSGPPPRSSAGNASLSGPMIQSQARTNPKHRAKNPMMNSVTNRSATSTPVVRPPGDAAPSDMMPRRSRFSYSAKSPARRERRHLTGTP